MSDPDSSANNFTSLHPDGHSSGSGTRGLAQSPFMKLLLIGFLILLMLIPMGMVEGVIAERQGRQYEAASEIANAWGASQTLIGPVLSVPYSVTRNKNMEKHTLYLLPGLLDVSTDLQTQTRSRGIFKSIVYTAPVKISGRFNITPDSLAGAPAGALEWSKATLLYGISDTEGIQEASNIQINGKSIAFQPTASVNSLFGSGIHAPISLAGNGTIPFSFQLKLQGSENFNLLPVGADTHIRMTSQWPNPSFIGDFLPEKPEVSDSGFIAEWKLSRFARSFPPSWTDEALPPALLSGNSGQPSPNYDIDGRFNQAQSAAASGGKTLGVSLLQSVDNYREATRSAKYAVLFLSLTFLIYFLCEVLLKNRIHAVQYLLVGLALCLFYLLLVSLSEFMGFLTSYAISAAATIALITAYSAGIARGHRWKFTLCVGSLLTLLYTYLYVLLQQETLSLLSGSIGLFVTLAAVMFATRRVDWYSIRQDAQ